MRKIGRTHTKLFDIQFAFCSVAELVFLFVLGLPGSALRAQNIEIKVVNGRNGHPIADKCIQVWVGDRAKPTSGPLLQTQTDKDGITRVRLTDEDTKISQDQQLACGLSGIINPVVKYGNMIGVRTGFILCQSRSPDYSWLAMTDFSTTELVERGIVTGNTCGKVKASPTPGMVIIFVRPLSWWEKLKQ